MLAGQYGWQAGNLYLVDLPRPLFDKTSPDLLGRYLRQRGIAFDSAKIVLLDDGWKGAAFLYFRRALEGVANGFSVVEHLMYSSCAIDGFNRIVGEGEERGAVANAVGYLNERAARHRIILGYRQEGERVVADYFDYRKLRPVFRGQVDWERMFFSPYAAPYLKYLDLYKEDRLWDSMGAFELYCILQARYIESILFDAEVALLRKLVLRQRELGSG
jgi:hypothetical protein